MVEDKEKFYIYIAFAVVAIILIIAIILIWKPMFSSNSSFSNKISKVDKYTSDSYFEKSVEDYKKVVKNLINKENYEEIFASLDEEYINKNNLNYENGYDFLINNNLLTYVSNASIIYNSDVKTDGNTYVYTYVYKVGSEEKKVHIIEDYYKNYKISFDQQTYPIINKEGYHVEKENLKFDIKIESSYKETLVLNVSVENNSTEEYIFNFNSVNSASAILKDSSSYNLTSAIVGNETSEIKSQPNSIVNFNLSFDINVKNQCNLSEIDFNNIIKNNGEETLISLLL